MNPLLKSVEKCITFGESTEADLRLTDRGRSGKRSWLEVNGRLKIELQLPGRHNAINALAAIAVGRRFSLTDEDLREGLAGVAPEAMRFQRQSVSGLDVFNDAYNANPESLIAALETFAELTVQATRRILVLGDMLELGEDSETLHREAGRYLSEFDRHCSIDRLITVGSWANYISETLKSSWSAARLVNADSADALVKSGTLDDLVPGDALLVKGSRGMALERVVEHLESSRDIPHPVVKKSRVSKRKKVKT